MTTSPKFSQAEIDALKLRVKIPALEVAKMVRFPIETSFSGAIDFELTPYLLFPISLIGVKGVHWIIIVAPTQSGKTVFLQVFVADVLNQKGGNCFYIMPTEHTAERGFDDKIIQMVKATPELMSDIKYPIQFNLCNKGIFTDNAAIYPVTANSLSQLSSMSCQTIVADEVRLFPKKIKAESNAIKLAYDRLTVFLESGVGQGGIVSSPSVEWDLLFQQLYRKDLAGNACLRPNTKVYFWYNCCPSCDKMVKLDFFKHVKLDKGINRAICLCPYCQNEIPDSDMKRLINSKGQYGEPSLDIGLLHREFPEPKKDKIVACRFSSMISPFRSFQTILDEYRDAQHDIMDYKNFIQCWIAEWFVDDLSTTTIEVLNERKTNLLRGVVPDWCQIITAGVDSQTDGFYYWVQANGNNKTHCIDAGFIDSDGVIDSNDIVRNKLSMFLENKEYYNDLNERWSIGLWAIDTGGDRTTKIYKSIEDFDKCIPCKGRSVDEGISESKNKRLFLVDTKIYLEITDSKCQKINWTMFKEAEDEIFRQFINVRKVSEVHKKTGNDVVYWKKFGRCDYRFACVHAEIALDFKLEGMDMTIKDLLTLENFKYNPAVRVHKAPEIKPDDFTRERKYEKFDRYDLDFDNTKGGIW